MSMSGEPDIIKAIHKHNADAVRTVIKNHELYHPGRLEDLFKQKSK